MKQNPLNQDNSETYQLGPQAVSAGRKNDRTTRCDI